LVTEIRNLLFDYGIFKITRVGIPVVSIGNIHVGGTGKTPLVIFLAQQLRKFGYTPVVLSRGYKGRLTGPHLVSDEDIFTEVGDEPILIRRKTGAPVVISKDRVKGAKFIEENKIGDLVLLDDGFQHRWLHRDVDILVLPSEDKELLPFGRLREDIKHKSRADVIVKKGERFSPESLYFLSANNPTPDFIQKPLTVVTGIANPDRVRVAIEKFGFKIEEFKVFPDHHPFSESERKEYSNAITTEKDFVRFPEAKAIVGYEVRVPGLVEEIITRLESKGFVPRKMF
jgi:tetraacyldisaccharide 4'-kinase